MSESNTATRVVEATVVEELPSLVYRLDLGNTAQELTHVAGSAPQRSGAEKSAMRKLS